MKEADIYVMYRFGGIVAAFRFSGKGKEGVERSEEGGGDFSEQNSVK